MPLFVLCLALFGLLKPALAYDLAQKVETFTLSNGMRWLLVYRPEIPVFSGVVLVRAGGMDEKPGKTGLAHMFEHMAFKGSKDIDQTNEVWETLTRKGAADLNAFTSKDLTGYHASMPANQFSLWAYVFSEMILAPVMRQFYPERDVVMEERRLRYDNSAHGFLLEALAEEAFPEGPYHFSAIGRFADLQTLTEEDAYAFHKTYYVPQNMTGVLVGAVSAAQAKPVLEKYFGRHGRGKNPPRPQTQSFAFQGEKRKTIFFPAEPVLVMAFHKPPAPARDDYVFDMLDALLCEGRTGRFYRRLVEELRSASQVYCSASFPGSRQENLLVIFAAPNRGTDLEKLEKELWAELEKIKTDLQAEELHKVRNAVLHDYFWGMKGNAGLAERLAYGETLLNDWRYLVNYPKVIESIGAKEIQSAAKKYFVLNNRVVLYRLRGDQKP